MRSLLIHSCNTRTQTSCNTPATLLQHSSCTDAPLCLADTHRAKYPGCKVECGPPLDLMAQASVKAFAQAILKRPGGLHILVNNAGLGYCKKSFTEEGVGMLTQVGARASVGRSSKTWCCWPQHAAAAFCCLVVAPAQQHVSRGSCFDADCLSAPAPALFLHTSNRQSPSLSP